MRVKDAILRRNSEDEFARSLAVLSDSGASVIHVQTPEVVRAVLALRKTILVEANQYTEWDIVNGFRQFDASNMFNTNVPGDSNIVFSNAFNQPMTKLLETRPTDDTIFYYVFVNPMYFWEEPVCVHQIQQYAHIFPSTPFRIVFVTPDISPPPAIADSTVQLRFQPPGHAELRAALEGVFDGVDADVLTVDEDEVDRICFAGAGMSKEAFEMYASLAIVEAADAESEVNADAIVAGISRGKTDIVNKNDILELYPVETMDVVGGMEYLKEWVRKRRDCYTEEASDFGVETPKGIVFVGPPGTGKSLSAKAIASELGVPLIRLDFGKIFQSLVGESESRIRTALRMVEAMSPCVLFVDEIDKGLGGIGGSGDSGTSSRVLGTFLTWLNDNDTPVFTVVTANNVDGLPPELLRRGRFDDIFATRLPAGPERRDVLRIHLAKRGYDIGNFGKRQVQSVITASRGYVPAEIEAAVRDGLVNAFAADEDFTMAHIVDALKDMTPLSRSHAIQIQLMTLWAKQNAKPAGKHYEEEEGEEGVEPEKRARIRTRNRRGGDESVH